MNLQTTPTLKKQLRQQIRLLRQALTVEQRLLADRLLAQQYQQHLANKQYRHLAVYIQQDGELGTNHLIDSLFQAGCHLYLPKLNPDTSNRLQFVNYHQQSKMQNNRFGIPEPVIDDVIAVADLELIFLPLTAFDLQGNRLGMGGGFYDRTLAHLSIKKPLLVGLAYDFQQVTACPVESFDQPLDMILTPTRVLYP